MLEARRPYYELPKLWTQTQFWDQSLRPFIPLWLNIIKRNARPTCKEADEAEVEAEGEAEGVYHVGD